jgi:hypothetical protein
VSYAPTATAVASKRLAPPSDLVWRLAPVVVSVLLAALYLILQPRTPDLPGHIFRAELFGREGFAIWNGQWYGGHHVLSYSVLMPPLSWLLSPQLVVALASVAATACFEPLARRHFGTRAARLGALWFAVGSATSLFSNRVPFALGLAFGLAALLALQRRHRSLSPGLALLSGLSSPVAGLFLALAGVAHGIAATGDQARRARVDGALLAVAGLGPPALLALAFPIGGYGPFDLDSWLPAALLGLGMALLLPRRERTLRVTGALYAAGVTLALVVPTQVGITSTRLGEVMAGPVLLCALYHHIRGRLVVPIVAVLCACAVWQWWASVDDISKWLNDPVAEESYFDPLREWLALRPDQARVEIPFTFGHWEGSEVASQFPLARGWLRQVDTGRHPIFYGGKINALNYASWLSENAVRYVALADAKPDWSSYRERALIERGLPYLKPRAEFGHWRVFEVKLPAPMVISQDDANITLEQLGSDEVLLRVNEPGDAVVRVRWTPYWLAKGGCVEPNGEWTRVTAPREGFLRLVTRFSPERMFQRGRRCNGV